MGSPLLDRRSFLRDGAAAAVALAVPAFAGCGATKRAAMARGPRAFAAAAHPHAGGLRPAGVTPPDPAAWKALAGSLHGRLVRPGERGYAVARQLFDPRFDTARPAAIAYCASAVDVQRAVDFARTHGIRPIPRCGGHSYAGYSTGAGLVIDVSRMSSVKVKRTIGRPPLATVGAGTRLVDLYAACARAGVLIPGGSCPTVGISGLALGGGIGVVARKYGMTCDAIQSLRIVTADGRLLTCDATSEPDLYWASRGGGGGNFGVVTSFTFKASPAPSLTLFTVDWPWAAAGDALGGWMRWLGGQPDELWSNFQLQSAGSAGLIARASGVFEGPTTELSRRVARLVAATGAQPSSRFVGTPDPYLHAMLVEAGCEHLSVAACHLKVQNPSGALQRSAYAAKSAYVARPFSSTGAGAATSAIERLHAEHPGLGGGLAFDAYGGAINRVAAGATAFVHRDALCAIQATLSWGQVPSGPAFAAGENWLAGAMSALAPHTTGGAYQNYIDPRLHGWAGAYYGPNLTRLTAVKRAYDPDNSFRFAQSIPLRA